MSKLKYGMATGSALAAFVGVAGLSLPQALAGDLMGTTQGSDLRTEQAKKDYAIEKQECDTLKHSQPEAYEPCLQKAQSLLTQTQGSGQGSQGSAPNQSQGQFSGQEKGPIDKMTSAVKETVADVKEKLFGSSGQGREGQPSAGQWQQGQGSGQGFAQQPSQQGFGAGSGQQGQNPGQWQQGQGSGQGFAQGQPPQQGLGTGGSQPQGQSMGQGQQGGVTQGPNPLQQGFEARHMQGQGSGQGGQNFGQQGPTGQQFGQQGQSGQGSFQGGNYGQQPQGQSWQQGTGGTNQQFQGQGQSGQGSFQGGQQPQGQSWQQGTGGTNQQFQGQQGQSGQGSFQGGNYGQQPQDQSGQQGTVEYALQKQECNTLKHSQPEAYEPCLQKAQSLLTQTQGSGQGSQASASNQFSGQEKGPIDKMTSAVKETVADVKEKLFGSSGQGREGQPSAGQWQQGQGSAQGQQPSQQGFGGGSGQQAQGQQFYGQQGPSGQGSFQGGNYSQQQPQGQSGQQGANQQQSGGTQGLQGSSNQQRGSTSGWIGAKQGEHMDRGEYYQVLALKQYVTLKQECNTLKQDPNVYEQCQKHADSTRDKIVGMAEERGDAGS